MSELNEKTGLEKVKKLVHKWSKVYTTQVFCKE